MNPGLAVGRLVGAQLRATPRSGWLALGVGVAPLAVFGARAGSHAEGVSVLLGMVLALPVALGGDGGRLRIGGVPWPTLPVSPAQRRWAAALAPALAQVAVATVALALLAAARASGVAVPDLDLGRAAQLALGLGAGAAALGATLARAAQLGPSAGPRLLAVTLIGGSIALVGALALDLARWVPPAALTWALSVQHAPMPAAGSVAVAGPAGRPFRSPYAEVWRFMLQKAVVLLAFAMVLTVPTLAITGRIDQLVWTLAWVAPCWGGLVAYGGWALVGSAWHTQRRGVLERLPVSLPGAWRRVLGVGWGLGLLLQLPQVLLHGFNPVAAVAPLGLAIGALPARTWGRARRIAAGLVGLCWLLDVFFPVLGPPPRGLFALAGLTLVLAFAPHRRSQP